MVRYLSTLILVVATSVDGSAQGSPTMFQGNAQHTGVVSPEPTLSVKGFAFAFKTGGPVRGTPAVQSGILCFGSGDGNVYALTASDGKERWRFQTGGDVQSSPAIDGEIVYAASRDGYLYALDLQKGTQKWRFRFGPDLDYIPGFDYYLSSPVVSQGVLYIGGGDGCVYALDAKSGRSAWKTPLGSRIRTSPALTASLVLVGTMDGRVIALSRDNGAVVWKFATAGADLKFEDYGFDRTAVVSSPSTDDEIVVVGGRDGFVYALNADEGELVWKFDYKISWAISTFGHMGGAVFGGTSDGKIFNALDKKTGQELWKYATAGPVWASPCFSANTLYCADYGGNVFALDIQTGQELWRLNLGDRIHGSPVVYDGNIYIGCDDGYLYALASSTKTGSSRPLKKVVFWEEPRGFSWFRNGVDVALRDYFKRNGYEHVATDRLSEVLQTQVRGDSQVVAIFAENRVPQELEGDGSTSGPFLRFLEAGGKAVWIGACPLAYRRDSTGKLTALDFSFGAKLVGVRYPGENLDRLGFYGSRPTAEGIRWD